MADKNSLRGILRYKVANYSLAKGTFKYIH